MLKTFFLEPNWLGTGLTNELFFIVYGIIHCINNNKQNLVINNFRLEPMTHKFCQISNILDIHYLNILLQKYGIIVFDRHNLSFNIDSIIYGLNGKTIDITKEIIELFYSDNKLVIPVGTILNNIKGDPCSGEAKKLYISYNINGNIVVEEYSEYIHQDIIIDLQNPTNILNWEQIDDCLTNNKELFEYLLKNIKFSNRLVKYSENALFIDKNNKYTILTNNFFENKKINVIHLRVEKDMTGHMLSYNKMTQEEYDDYLQNKYIKLIKQYFSKDDVIFVLTYDLKNNVVKFLKENDYNFYYTKKYIFDGREQHAIIDLLIGQKCNNYFIGNWNFGIRQGSTFTYLLYLRNNAINNIFIDMYDIKEKVVVVNKNINLKQEKTLLRLVNNKKTDKNTIHSYLNLYEKLLHPIKHSAKNILEIGIGYPGDNGGSIKMWHDYFLNANIYALDIQHINDVWDEIKDKDRIKLFTSNDAYDEINFKELFLDKNIKFDMMLDDGPHSLDSMKQFIKLYSQIMTEDGILMIEDVQSIEWIEELKSIVPENLKKYIQVYDLRHIKNRYDDIVFVINKNKIFEVDSSIDGTMTIKYILENNIEGVLVECGVDGGKFEEIWINELIKNNIIRDIYLYDTFTGLTEPGENDYTCNDAVLYKMTKDNVHKEWESHIINDNVNNWCYTPLENVKNKLNSTGYPENKIHYIVGDVLKTLQDKNNIPKNIAVLRLDTDWYESSKYELEQMYDNVVYGGVIIFDDYYHWQGQRKATDDFFKKINMNYHFININNGKTAAIIKK
jgi:glutaredoxin-related protein